MNQALVDMDVEISIQVPAFDPLCIYPDMKFLDPMVTQYLISWGTAILNSTANAPFAISRAKHRTSHFHCILCQHLWFPAFGFFFLFCFFLYHHCVVVICICLILDVKHLCMHLVVICILFEKYLFKSFVNLWIRLFGLSLIFTQLGFVSLFVCLLLFGLESPWYTLDTTHSSDI